REQIAALEKNKDDLLKTIPATLVSMSGTPRTTRILPRGNWLTDSGDAVEPAIPKFLGQLDVKSRPTRLDLAHWLISRDNPMVAGVFVNRLWKLYFGYGICRKLEDFGSQGEWPVNPELLDWLAVEFMESGWDIKHMIRLMVTSGT